MNRSQFYDFSQLRLVGMTVMHILLPLLHIILPLLFSFSTHFLGSP